MTDMKYKNYIGSVEVSEVDDCLFGKLLHINDLVTYEAETPKKLKVAFDEAVDEYLADCKELGKKPDTPYKGVFNVRTRPATHRKAALLAETLGMKLNTFANEAIVLASTVVESASLEAKAGDEKIFVTKWDADAAKFVVVQHSFRGSLDNIVIKSTSKAIGNADRGKHPELKTAAKKKPARKNRPRVA